MGHTITVRLSKELAEWLEETAARTGARESGAHRGFMRLAGSVRGPKNLSRRKGFAQE
jgi:hypothetical protein